MAQINRKIARIQKNLSCSNVRHPSNGLQIQRNPYPNSNVMGRGYAIIHIDSQKFQISKNYLEHKEQV